MINIRRVARVVAGGRRFSFSVAIIIGNKKGKVGVGLGKAGDTTLAIDKAVRDAKKHMITVPSPKTLLSRTTSRQSTTHRACLCRLRAAAWWQVPRRAGARARRHHQHCRQDALGQQRTASTTHAPLSKRSKILKA
jgi:hypothetical protein